MSDSDDAPPQLEAPTWENEKEMGNACFNNGDYDASLSHYGRAINLNPEEASLYSNRAMALLKQKKFDLAEKDAEKCLALNPNFIKAYSRLATALCANAKFHEAAQQLKRAVDICNKTGDKQVAQELQVQMRNASLASVAIQQAEKSLADKQYSAACRALGHALSLYPDTWKLMKLFAEAKMVSEPDDAIQCLSRFTASHSGNPDYLCCRAQATFYTGSNGAKNAVLFLREALSVDPDHAPSQKLLKKVRNMENIRNAANAAYSEKRWADAIAGYTDALAIDPLNKRLNAVILANRAAAKIELKDYRTALQDVNTAIEGGNDAPKIYARRARINQHLENWDDAVRDMTTACESDPQYKSELKEVKELHRQSKRKDYYKVLGVEKSCPDADLKRAYKKAALVWHPDKWASSSEAEKLHAEKMFKEVGEAFSMLGDPKKRQLYDSGQMDNEAEGRRGPGGMGGGMGGDPDVMSMFNMMFAGGGMGGMGGGGRRGGSRGSPFGMGGGVYYE